MYNKHYNLQADNTGGKQEEQLKGQATEAQITEWKTKYKYGIYAMEVDGHIGYFKNPGRNELNCAMSKASSEAAFDMYEELTGRTFLGGSEDVLKDDQKFFGVVQQVKVKMDGKKATLVNL